MKWFQTRLWRVGISTPFIPTPFGGSWATRQWNGKSAVLGLRPELVVALKAFRPELSQPFEWAFWGKVPNMDTFKRDLRKASIGLLDEAGRRVDFHSLRTTFISHLQANGASPRAVMELARHSDMKLSQTAYMDAALLPLTAELARLPSVSSQRSPKKDALRSALSVAVSGLSQAPSVATGRNLAFTQEAGIVAFRPIPSQPDLPGRDVKVVDPIRVDSVIGEKFLDRVWIAFSSVRPRGKHMSDYRTYF